MADVITRRIIELDVKTSGDALRAMKQQQESLKAMEKSIQNAQSAVKNFAMGFVGAFSAQAVVSGIKGMINGMDDLMDASQQLGIGVKDLQAWNHAAEMSGSNADEMAAGIRGLSKSMADMDNETAASTKALKAFGVTANDDVNTALTKIAEGFSKLPDGPQKTALAMDLLGKAGTKLLPILNEGAEGLQKMAKEAEDVGTFTRQAGEEAAKFNDQLDLIQKNARGAGYQLVSALLPALNAIAESLTGSRDATSLWTKAGDYLGDVLTRITMVGQGAVGTLTAIAQALFGLVKGAQQFLNKDFSGALETVKETANTVGKTLDTTTQKLVKLRDSMDVSTKGKRVIEGLMPRDEDWITPEKFKPPGGGGGTKVKAQRDETLEYLKRFTESTLAAAAGVKEMTAAEQLQFEIGNKNLKITTEKQKAAYELAKAAASAKDIAELQKKMDEAANAEAERRRANEAARINDLVQTREAMLDLVDPTRTIVREMEKLNEVMSVTFDDEQRAKLEAYNTMLRQDYTAALMFGKQKTQDLNKSLESLGETLAKEIQGYAKEAASALVDFAVTGKQSVSDMVQNILMQFAKLAVQKQMQPLFDTFSGWVSTLGQSAKGNVFGPSGIQAFSSGGVVGGPTLFGMSGGGTGLMGEAGPEAIVPLRRTASGDLGVQASPVSVTVINNAGANVKTEESRGTNGEQQIRILVNQAVEEGIGRGRFDRVMTASYGVSRKGR